MIKLNSSTRLALQAAVAVTLAVLFGWFFHLDRSYWAIMTALYMVSQTWGESIKKSFERVSMTIAGGVVGTLLFFIMPNQHALMLLCLLLAIFFAVFFFTISYLISVFFITIFIVFLFAILGNWDLQILEERIYETFIGAVIAVIATALILPTQARETLPELFGNFMREIKQIIQLSFHISDQENVLKLIDETRKNLFLSIKELNERVKISQYELFFTIYNRGTSTDILSRLLILSHYSTSLLEVSPQLSSLYEDPELSVLIKAFETRMLHNLESIQTLFVQPVHAELQLFAQDEINAFNKTLIGKLKENTDLCLDGLCFIYFLQKINEVLLELRRKIV